MLFGSFKRKGFQNGLFFNPSLTVLTGLTSGQVPQGLPESFRRACLEIFHLHLQLEIRQRRSATLLF